VTLGIASIVTHARSESSTIEAATSSAERSSELSPHSAQAKIHRCKGDEAIERKAVRVASLRAISAGGGRQFY